jgi:hypothetical protein
MLTAPQTLPGGQRAWVDGQVAEFTQRLAEFNPNLALYQDPDGSWLIAEITPDGAVHYVMRSKPGAHLGPQVIEKLAQGDRRHHDVAGRVAAHNDKVERDSAEAEREAKLVALDNLLSKTWVGRVPSNVEDLDI